MRLTDADALIGDVRDRYCKNCVKRKGIKNGKCRFIYEIGEAPCRACDVEDMIYELENAPTVDPVKHGHWVEVQRIHETDHTAICECSLCGDTVWVYDGQRAWNYCPSCGAKMDEVKVNNYKGIDLWMTKEQFNSLYEMDEVENETD